MVSYPLQFEAQLIAKVGKQTAWASRVENSLRSELPCDIPPEFGGRGQGLSPEDFYVLAVINCFTATFKVFAERASFLFEDLEVHGKLTIDRDERGMVGFRKVAVKVKLKKVSDGSLAQQLLKRTETSCFVLNSLKIPIEFHYDIQI